jgi:biotin carboxyl carrier protein
MSLSNETIAALAARAHEAGLRSLEVETKEWRLKFVLRHDNTPPAKTHPVTAPAFGRFLDRHPAREVPFAQPGDRLREGAVIGLLQVGPVYRPVIAFRAGTLAALRVAPGQLVGFGEPVAEITALPQSAPAKE